MELDSTQGQPKISKLDEVTLQRCPSQSERKRAKEVRAKESEIRAFASRLDIKTFYSTLDEILVKTPELRFEPISEEFVDGFELECA